MSMHLQKHMQLPGYGGSEHAKHGWKVLTARKLHFSSGAAAAACSVPLAGTLLSWSVLPMAEGCICCRCCRCCCCCDCCCCSSSACCSSSFHSRVSGSRMSPYRAASSAAHPVAMKGALHGARLLRSLRQMCGTDCSVSSWCASSFKRREALQEACAD